MYLIVFAACLPLSVGCKGDSKKGEQENTAKKTDTPPAADPGAKPKAEAEPKTEAEPKAEVKPEEPVGPCPTKTALTLNNIKSSPHLDGATGAISEGSFFANVSMGKNGSLVFAEYTIERGQFGLSAPTGDPKAPEGKIIFAMKIGEAAEGLVVGDYNKEGKDADGIVGRLEHISMYRGSKRVVPLGTHTLTVTEINEKHICGELKAIGDTALQTFPYVTGRFNIPVVK